MSVFEEYGAFNSQVIILIWSFVCKCLILSRMGYRHSGSVVERPLCDREVAGSIPGRVIPKTLKMVLAALSLVAQH